MLGKANSSMNYKIVGFPILIMSCVLFTIYVTHPQNSSTNYLNVYSYHDMSENKENLSLGYRGSERTWITKGNLSRTMLETPRRYAPPPLAEIEKVGQTLNVADVMMTSLNMPKTFFSVLDGETVKDFVFVIGASSNHFKETKDAIAGVQTHMPGYKILYYDLGLSDAQIKELATFCDVTYHKFEFSRYPRHVRRLLNYSFKPLIIQDALRHHRALVWMDASFRLLRPMDVVYPQIQETGGFLQFWHSPHSNYAVTDPRMYEYIPTIVERQKTVMSRAAGAVYWHTTEKVYWNILYWWVLCALDEHCIAPAKARLGCNFRRGNEKVYAGCHRFDMSVLNVLASNLYGYDDKVYTSRRQDVVKIVKHATSNYALRHMPCST